MIQVLSAALALRACLGSTLRGGPPASRPVLFREEDETIRMLVETMAASS